MYQVKHYIDGASVAGNDDHQPIYNPATGEKIAEVTFADTKQVEQAVQAASRAFPQWSAMPANQRAQILFRFKGLLEQRIDDIATIVTREHGKVLDDARGSVRRGIEVVEQACAIASQLRGHYSDSVASGIDCYDFRQPLGVCVGISPFNFPVMIPLWVSIPAIACGNTVVLKPSEKDPSAPLYLAELLTQAGLPPGVLNVIHGAQKTVENLIDQPQVQAVTAVGSTPVAQGVYQRAVNQGKRAQTFGGAKNHAVVMPDANVKNTAKQITAAAYGAAGERCMAISAVLAVGDKLADQLVNEIIQCAEGLRMGVGDNPDIDMGPLISAPHRERVLACIAQGETEGAKLVLDKRNVTVDGFEKGFFVGPCLFDHVETRMQIYQQEIFGPVLVVLRVDDIDQAIAIVNENRYGNGTAIFTQNGFMAREYVRRVKVGMVGINVPIPVPVAFHGFGGWKESCFGDSRLHGEHTVRFYTREKTVTSRWIG